MCNGPEINGERTFLQSIESNVKEMECGGDSEKRFKKGANTTNGYTNVQEPNRLKCSEAILPLMLFSIDNLHDERTTPILESKIKESDISLAYESIRIFSAMPEFILESRKIPARETRNLSFE